MIIQLENLTENTIDIPSDSSIIELSQLETKTIFDNDDLETYLTGLYVIQDGYETIKEYIENDTLKVFIDSVEIDSKTWIVTRNLLFGDLFGTYQIGFSSDKPIYFNFFTNELNIYNPVTQKNVKFSGVIDE